MGLTGLATRFAFLISFNSIVRCHKYIGQALPRRIHGIVESKLKSRNWNKNTMVFEKITTMPDFPGGDVYCIQVSDQSTRRYS